MIEEVYSHFHANGMNPTHLVPDGKLHRFPLDKNDRKKSGWYVGYRNEFRGAVESFFVFVYGNLREDDTFKYKPDLDYVRKVDPSALDVIAKNIKKAQEKAATEKLEEQKVVAEEQAEKFGALKLEGESPYLVRKQISGMKELGIGFEGDKFYIPMRDIDGKIWSLQSIDANGDKNYATGGKKKGTMHVFGNLEDAETIFIGEGFSTMASVFMATGKTCVCAFDSGNLEEAAIAVARKYKNRKYIITGDNDQWKVLKDTTGKKKNGGKLAAEKAAKSVCGTAIFPIFHSKWDSKEPTDFNDMHCFEGIAAVESELNAVEESAEEVYITSLGFKEKTYYFSSSTNKQLVDITKFSKADLWNLMPNEYWMQRFPKLNANKVESLSAFDVDAAVSSLMMECRQKGIFEMVSVRGCGVWIDEGRVVVNTGRYLVVNGQKIEFNKLRTKFFYQLSTYADQWVDEGLTKKECAVILELCNSFKWKRKSDSIILAGAIAIAKICGATPVRPHLWITGERGSGKTSMLQKLIKPLIGSMVFNVTGRSTEAGIRQTLKADARPVLFDEFETTGDDENQKRVIEMLRGAYSDTDALTVKGSSGGNAVAFQTRCSAIVSSIRTNLLEDADRSRFAVVELLPHKPDPEQWARMVDSFAKITPEFSDRFFTRLVRMAPIMLENFAVFKHELARTADSRFGDLYGMVLACYALLIKDTKIEPEEAKVICLSIDLEREKEDSKELDQATALHHMLTTNVKDSGGALRSIASLVSDMTKVKPSAVDASTLSNLGLRIQDESLLVAKNHAQLRSEVFAKTKWANGWANAFERLPGAKFDKQRIGDMNVHCVRIPLTTVALEK